MIVPHPWRWRFHFPSIDCIFDVRFFCRLVPSPLASPKLLRTGAATKSNFSGWSMQLSASLSSPAATPPCLYQALAAAPGRLDMREKKFSATTLSTAGRMRHRLTASQSIFRSHLHEMEPGSWRHCSLMPVGGMLLLRSTTGGTTWSRDTLLIAHFFAGLRSGRKTAHENTLRGMEGPEFAVWSSAPALCHWGSITRARCAVCLIRPCWPPSPEVRAWKRSTTCSSIRRRHYGRKSKMFGDSTTLLSYEVTAMKKSIWNVAIEAVGHAA
jgi:hypothetical protein